MLGVRNERQKDQQRQRVNPPQRARRGAGIGDKERGQIGGHQNENQQRNHAGLLRELLAEPLGPNEEPADKEAENAGCAGKGKGGGKVEVEAAKSAGGIEEADSEDRWRSG